MNEAEQVEALMRVIKPILAGKNPKLQGAVLAELTAIWLWGHQVPEDAGETDGLRREILNMHSKAILHLTELFDLAGRPV
jgi:hypothetical protein